MARDGGVVVREAIESFKAEIISRVESAIEDFHGLVNVVDALAKKPAERATKRHIDVLAGKFQERLEEVVPKIDDFVALLLTSGRKILDDGSVNVSDLFLDSCNSAQVMRA